jgi:hypothetical protein
MWDVAARKELWHNVDILENSCGEEALYTGSLRCEILNLICRRYGLYHKITKLTKSMYVIVYSSI